jgi:hypothetical protein
MTDWTKEVANYFNELPHPQAPELKVGEYVTAVKLATKAKFGGHAEPHEAAAFWGEFQQANKNLIEQKKSPLTPEEFGHLLDRIAPVSFAYHGRPPTIPEIVRNRDAHPKDVYSFYGNLPDEHYPHVPAQEMVKHLEAARPWSQMLLGEKPLKLHASYLYHSGHNPKDFYQSLKEQRDQSQQEDQQPAPGQTQPGMDQGGTQDQRR